ncbi:MAG TPA: FHA domain-containing protein [Polyangiaceae bacterium]
MARFRLRFLLQEIDLPLGDTVIGRSARCQVTLEDPLVSREHARIRIVNGRASIEDLGSRNGVQIGGVLVQGLRELADGDRIRLGSQELVFCAGVLAGGRGFGDRPTGFLSRCASCGQPYSLELAECPACGSSDRNEEDTLTGQPGSVRDWGLALLVEALERATSLDQRDDVERILAQARLGIEQRIGNGEQVERATLDVVADAAATLSATRGDAAWGRWLLSVYASMAAVPPRAVAQTLRTLPASERTTLAPGARRVMESVSSRGGPAQADRERFERLTALLESTRV